MNPRVLVLLATYNGERFLREQIESILDPVMGQSYPWLRMMARDDGSQDGTAAILEEYARKFPDKFAVLPDCTPSGEAKWNFLRLIEAALAQEDSWDYLALADQDDVWQPDKMEVTVAAMQELAARHPVETPLLVFTDLRVVDERLETIYPSMWAQQRLHPQNVQHFERIMVQNVITGCTALINRPLASRMTLMPAEAAMHDWWMAMLAGGLGDSAAVQQQMVSYRQHASNVAGAVLKTPTTGLPKQRDHQTRRKHWEMIERQAEALLRIHGAELAPDKRRVLEALVRCETHPSRWMRAFTWLRYGLRPHTNLRVTLGLMWYLWDMDAAKATTAKPPR
jgi:glycosyltransferase involved in cell wall biosynthesis